LILEPCGIIPIHTHPRADEFFYLLKGDNFKNFFIHESGPKSNTIKAGESFIFPMGYVHGQINDSCEPAEGIASLNSYDAGVLLLAPGLVSLDND
jgi:quercetin dioxygenase-like cupin family protein